MKKFIALAFFLLLVSTNVYAAEFKFSGKASPGQLVSIMITDIDADTEQLSNDEVKHVEILQADNNGYFSADFEVDGVVLDENNQVTNCKLISNVDGLDLNTAVRIKTQTSISEGISVDENGVVFVPLVSAFAQLGIDMTEKSDGIFTGRGNNGDIEIVIGKDTAEVDWVDIELPAPTKYLDGVPMIPAYLLEDAAKIDSPVYDETEGVLYLNMPDPNDVYEEEFNIANIVDTLPEGTTIVVPSSLKYSYAGSGSSYMSLKWVRVSDENFTNALRVTTYEYPYGEIPSISAMQFIVPVSGAIKAGETALLSFKARALEVTDESGKAIVATKYERTSDWANAMYESFTIEPGEWQQFYFPIYSEYYDFEKTGTRIVFYVGGKPQSFEIADLSVISYGTSVDISTLNEEASAPYKGMGEDALWRKEAYRRIEKYRKGDTAVTVTDQYGNPVQDAVIQIEQTESEFMFGIALCESEVVGLDETTEKGKIQSDVINNSFNTGVCEVEMKPTYMEDSNGLSAIAMANEFLSLGKRLRGHTLIWDATSVYPFEDCENMSYEELYRGIMGYVLPTVQLFKGKIAQWDVINEPYGSNWLRLQYGTRLFSDVFKAVDEIDPDAKLYVNETGLEGRKDKYTQDRVPQLVNIVNQMKSEGAPIDGIGIQAHCTSYYYPQGFYHQIDDCAQAVDEISVTEYDFRNENGEYADEHLRDTLLATFSHPKAKAFVIWGYWDPMHWRNCAPFYDKDWNEKPAKAVWDRMVNEEFKTNTTVLSDKNGLADFRGFYGDYNITVTYNGKTITVPFRLTDSGDNHIHITVGDEINAVVSAEPEGNIAPIEYNSFDEAKQVYKESLGEKYEGVVIESNFRGVAAESLVASGGDLSSNDDYNSGLVWGSNTGASGVAADSASGMVLKNVYPASADIRRKIQGTIFENSDVELSYSFTTYSARENSFSVRIAFSDSEDRTVAVLRSSTDGYTFKTVGGNVVPLDDNTSYRIYITLLHTENGAYSIKYSLYSGEKNVVFETISAQTAITASEDVCAAVLLVDTSGGGSSEVVRFENCRVKYTTYDEIIEFSAIDYPVTILDNSMRDVDLYAISDVEGEPFLNGEEWGYMSSDHVNNFRYEEYMHYLWSIRNVPSGEQILARRFDSVETGETLDVDFDMQIFLPVKWYDSDGYTMLSIGNSDRTTEKWLFKFTYGTTGSKLNLLSADGSEFSFTEGVPCGTVNDLNRNKMHVNVRFTPDGSGLYDAAVTLVNEFGKTYTAVLNGIMTIDEFESLNTLYFSTATQWSGTEYGNKVVGLKNIVMKKSGVTGYEQPDAVPVFKNGSNIGISYNNITGRPFAGILTIAAYSNGRLVGIENKEFNISSDKETGSLNFIVNKNDNADLYKAFLMKDYKTLVPYKASDLFKLDN